MKHKGIDFLIETINYLVRQNAIQEALDLMVKEVAPIKDTLSNRINAAYQSYTMSQNMIMTPDQKVARLMMIGQELTNIANSIKPTLELLERVNNYKGFYSREVKMIVDQEEDMVLEKIIGDSNNLINVNWLIKGLKAANSVCQIRVKGKAKGTGWLLEGGWLMTNAHVLPHLERVGRAEAVFNYQDDDQDQNEEEVSYTFENEGAKFSKPKLLDYAYLKIKDDPDNPISQWGHLTVNHDDIPNEGDRITIIQHPDGEHKQIALHQNKVLKVNKGKSRIFYTTDTRPGSSGSPCFNMDWEVIALHHAGKIKDGGFEIDPDTGEKAPSNRGVLIDDIMNDIEKPNQTEQDAD